MGKLNVYNQAKKYFEYTQRLRRQIHRHPEIGFQEEKTSALVAIELEKSGLKVTRGIAKTGVVGILEGVEKNGPTILLRFDMDALPIQEENTTEYASAVPGVMHACGHDAHVAVGLTVAKILSEHRDLVHGVIKFMFQPGEEGLGGAAKMIEEGVLVDPTPDYALGFHVWNEKPVGWTAITPGPFMAGADIFSIRVTGKGGHGALPNQSIDPVIAAAHIVTALQTIVSRNISPLDNAVVSVACIEAGDAFNVIPEHALIKGTFRSFEPEIRETILQKMELVSKKYAEGLGCQAEFVTSQNNVPVVNNGAIAEIVDNVVSRLFPEEIINRSYRTMGSEDMSFVLNEIPGCYFFVGSSNDSKGLNYGHHHPRFDFDEDVLPKAVAIIIETAFEIMNKKS